MKTGASLRFESGSVQEVIYDCYIGIVVGARHYLWFASKWFLDYLLNPTLKLSGFEAPQDDLPPPIEQGELKVVGIGFGRTGTVRYVVTLLSSLVLIPLSSIHLCYDLFSHTIH
jgi:hypothetical protein